MEEGNITPAFDLELWNPFDKKFGYRLVWNDMVLREGLIWGNLVVNHGMSFTEPNDITVVTVESP